jgi:hypothetical protein
MSNQISKLLFKILKGYGVPITYRAIAHEINTHPAYPSMGLSQKSGFFVIARHEAIQSLL